MKIKIENKICYVVGVQKLNYMVTVSYNKIIQCETVQ